MKRFIVFIGIISLCVSCTKNYSTEIMDGKTLYIVESKAGLRTMVPMSPVNATLSMKSAPGEKANVTVSYTFESQNGNDQNRIITLSIPGISVTKDSKSYLLAGSALTGLCSFKEGTAEYSNASVNGTVNFDGNSQLSISGSFGEQFFSFEITKTAPDNPGDRFSDQRVIIEWAYYQEIQFVNKTSREVQIKVLATDETIQNNSITLQRDKTGTLGFYAYTYLVPSIEVSFSGGESFTVPSDEAWNMKAGDKTGCVEYIGKELDWFLRSEEIMGIEPERYERNIFGIVNP